MLLRQKCLHVLPLCLSVVKKSPLQSVLLQHFPDGRILDAQPDADTPGIAPRDKTREASHRNFGNLKKVNFQFDNYDCFLLYWRR